VVRRTIFSGLEFICIWSGANSAGGINKKIAPGFILEDTIDFRFAFQGTGITKGIHPVFTTLYLLSID
jgi:hypothetical protein